MAQPPVAKFLDFGQYKYELTKKEKENKRRQRSVTFKEIRLSPKIGVGDFDTKVHRAIEFLEEGDRIKVTVRFRGRELTHPEIGRNMIARFVDRVKDHGVAERTPLLEGKSMHITMASLHKPRSHDAPRPAGQGEAATAPQGASAPAAASPAAPAPAAQSAPAQAAQPAAATEAQPRPAQQARTAAPRPAAPAATETNEEAPATRPANAATATPAGAQGE